MANNTIKILLIDDCPDAKELIEEHLNMSEHGSLEFVIDYIEFFDSKKIDFPYDIYIVDDIFGGISMSVDITKKIRKQHPDGNIFILSGQAKENTLKELINQRVNGFIEKDNINISPIIKASESIYLLRQQIDRLNSKISRLISM